MSKLPYLNPDRMRATLRGERVVRRALILAILIGAVLFPAAPASARGWQEDVQREERQRQRDLERQIEQDRRQREMERRLDDDRRQGQREGRDLHCFGCRR